MKQLTNIQFLFMRNNLITDIEVLSNLVNLRQALLYPNRIRSVRPLTKLKNLTYTDLHLNAGLDYYYNHVD